MARVKLDEADKYGGQGGAGFFQLKDDGDTARVRFMYDTVDDIVADSVHEIDTGKKSKTGRPIKKYVNCPRSYNDPVDDCPFCREGKYTVVKLFIPVYNVDEDKVQIWERGKTYFKRMTRIASKYPDIVSQVFEIERIGVAGDQQTQYDVTAIGKPDGTTLDDLPPLPKILGGHVIDASPEDMEYYLEEGQFPPSSDEEAEEELPVRRRGGNDREREEAPRRRRTPARNNEDSF